MVLTAAVANVSRQWPDYRVSGITLPAREGMPLEVNVRIDSEHSLRAFVDARSGEVLGTYRLEWMAWISSLHHRLLFPDDIARIGQQTIGWFGIVLFLVSLSGLSIWGLRGARWARIFGGRRGTVRRFTTFDLHRSVGIIGNVLLLFVALTGIVVVFPRTSAMLMGGGGEAPPVPRPAASSRVTLNLEKYVEAARNAVPDCQVRRLVLPAGASRALTVYVHTRGDLRPGGSTRVFLDPATGGILGIDRPSDWPLARQIVQAATPIHFVQWGGVGVQMLFFIVGLMPTVLFVSGIVMWWTPMRARRKAGRRVIRETNALPV